MQSEMLDEFVNPGEIWEYKGNKYVVHAVGSVRTWFKVKDTNDSNWYNAVGYSPTTEHTERRFIRRKDDFLAKFTLVKED